MHRTVRITPDEQPGLTRWEALLPADRSRLMWSAVEQLAHEYRTANPALSVAQSRADALTDLVLSEVQVTTTATIVLPASTALVPDQSPVDPGPDVQPSHTRPADTAPADTGPANPDSPQVDAEPTDTLPTDAAPSEPVLTSEPAGSGSRGPVAVPRVNPPPMCRCGRPLRSWADVLHPPARLTRVDLTDRHDRHHDGPVSMAGRRSRSWNGA